jgi:hypothetical protein
LNHHPGSIHILELAEKLNLTDDQKKKTQQIYDEMERQAKELGEKFIAIEKTIDDGFAKINV